MQYGTPVKRVEVRNDRRDDQHKAPQETQRESLEARPLIGFDRLRATATGRAPKKASGQRSAWFQSTLRLAALNKVPAQRPAAQPLHQEPTPAPAMSRPWPYWLVFAAVLLACAYLLLRPTPVPQWFAGSDKLGHAGFFFALALLGYRATARVGTSFVLLVTGLFGFAIGSEWLQQTSLLPLRHANASDLVADIVGLVLGLTLAMALDQRRRWSLRPVRT